MINLNVVLIRDAPIIGVGQLVRWYRPIVIYTIGKYKFLLLLPKVNKHDSGFFPVKVFTSYSTTVQMHVVFNVCGDVYNTK